MQKLQGRSDRKERFACRERFAQRERISGSEQKITQNDAAVMTAALFIGSRAKILALSIKLAQAFLSDRHSAGRIRILICRMLWCQYQQRKGV
nr:hypothetical protein [Desulfitobacterium hafniense]